MERTLGLWMVLGARLLRIPAASAFHDLNRLSYWKSQVSYSTMLGIPVSVANAAEVSMDPGWKGRDSGDQMFSQLNGNQRPPPPLLYLCFVGIIETSLGRRCLNNPTRPFFRVGIPFCLGCPRDTARSLASAKLGSEVTDIP